MDTREMQKRVYENKIKHHFNITDIPKEFHAIHCEVDEAYTAWQENNPTLGEELADVAIYLLGLAEILHIDLGAEIARKAAINEVRVYRSDGTKYIPEEAMLKLCHSQEFTKKPRNT